MPGATFDYLHHPVTVPVTAAGHGARFIVDSGIGLTIVTDRFANRRTEPGPETFTGRRMSGQAVTIPLARLPVEVDMGSDVLILNDALANDVGVTLDDPGPRVVDGRDETGQPHRRRFGAFQGRIHPVGAPALAQQDPDVMFQDIRYEGLIGHAFLRRFTVTFDIPARRLVFS